MKNALIVVANELKYNEHFIAYLKREVHKNIGTLDLMLFVSKNDESISKEISHVSKSYDNVVIAATESFELVGKILSTQTSDSLVHRENMLLPSKSTVISEDSYLVNHVNVIRIHVGKKIPEILLHVDKENGVYLFCDEHEAKRFEKLSSVFEVESLKTMLIEGLWYFSLTSQSKIAIERLLKECTEIITQKIITGNALFSSIAQSLIDENKTITFAESCTGGLIASEFTKTSGVSSVFKGSIVSYANEVKNNLVGVSEQTLVEHGAVSVACVREMLDGVMERFDADFSLAVSGIAGPDGGSLEKPVGTVIVGVKKRKKSAVIKKLTLSGDRIYIQQNTLFWAFKLLVLSDEKLFFKFVSKSLDK